MIIFYLPLSNFLVPFMINYIFYAHSFSYPSIKYPHSPSFPTDYFGPPLLSAITGTLQYIASHGTIPKCSFFGVYRTQAAFLNNPFLSSLEIEVKKTVLSATPYFSANYPSYLRCSIFSDTLGSYPPAITSL